MLVSRESVDWIGVEILNMFDIGSRPTIMKSVADTRLESAVYTTDSNANQKKSWPISPRLIAIVC